MAYRLDPRLSFADEVRRVATEQLTAAADFLDNRPDGLHEAIHDARKKFKRVRGLYRLVGMGDKAFRRRENARLRDAAASLSLVRDATAVVETLAHLAGHAESGEETHAVDSARARLVMRRDRLAENEAGLEDKARAAAEASRDGLAAVEAEAFPEGRRKVARLIGKGWARGLQRATHALDQAAATDEAEDFHELRKAGQTYWMQLSLLRGLWPSAIGAKRDRAKALVDMLGHEHDLSVLLALLDAEGDDLGGQGPLMPLRTLSVRRRAALRGEGLKLARNVFADPPQREADIVSLLWLESGLAD